MYRTNSVKYKYLLNYTSVNVLYRTVTVTILYSYSSLLVYSGINSTSILLYIAFPINIFSQNNKLWFKIIFFVNFRYSYSTYSWAFPFGKHFI